MDSASLNHYEEQLYSVFKTFDVDNSEALNKAAVLALCDALQLEERGATLVDTLFDKRTQRVTFAQFRSGLLAVLGADGEPAPPPDPPDRPPHSDDDSSGREVAPKFVFGSKKYGRRSRPPRSSSAPEDPPSPSRTSDDVNARRKRCKRSASAMETRPNMSPAPDSTTELDHDSRIDCERALALCRQLRMDGIDRRMVERIFENTPTSETTVGEFFDRLNSSLTSSIAATCESTSVSRASDVTNNNDDIDGTFPNELVVEAWESAGVQRPRRLLAELGFAGVAVRVSDLERSLDDELSTLGDQPDARALLLLASVALSRLRYARASRRAEAAAAERDRLRADVAESNNRARVLALEVDESHARLEAELTSLRRSEARHAEAARAAELDRIAEKERVTAEKSRIEAELARRVELETKLRIEADMLKERAEELEARAISAEERAKAAERERARLATELLNVATEEKDTTGCDTAAQNELTSRLEELRIENKSLRDRCDELCAELEVRGRRHSEAALGQAVGASWCEEAATANESDIVHEQSEECDSSLISVDQRVIGHTEVSRRLHDLLDNVQRITRDENQNLCTTCSALTNSIGNLKDKARELADTMIIPDVCNVETSNSGIQSAINVSESNTQTDGSLFNDSKGDDSEEVQLLRRKMNEMEFRYEEEKGRLSGLVKELEVSLEAMRQEYDKCEEYWSSKLAEERSLQAEEQRAGDERLAELVARIAEYERQFARGLPPIDERGSLETQVTDLEEEFEQYRLEKETELESKNKELARLSDKISSLESELVESKQRAEKLQSDVTDAKRRVELLEHQRPASLDCLDGGNRAISCAELEAKLRRQAYMQQQHHQRQVQTDPNGNDCPRCAHIAHAWTTRWAINTAAQREAAALRARLARAESAVASLTTRLQAADLLVKDLYVENCLLGPPPRRL